MKSPEYSPETTKENGAEKPPVLYHGTLRNDIEEFNPRRGPERPDEGAKVYASPYFEIAAQSMANKFVSNGGIVNGRKFICIPMSREEFIAQDKGGTVYTFPSESFKINTDKGFGGDKEWVSETSVKPIGKIEFPSLLEKMLEQGTEVYFIKPEMIPEITKAQDENSKDLEVLLRSMAQEQKS